MVDWVTLLASVTASVLGSVLFLEYRLRREQTVEQSAEVEQWYTDSYGYAVEVRRVWRRLFDEADRQGMNLSELQSEMSLLEGQISRHASNGEQLGINQDVIDALDELAAECRRPSNQTLHTNSLTEFQDLQDSILSAVDDVEQALGRVSDL